MGQQTGGARECGQVLPRMFGGERKQESNKEAMTVPRSKKRIRKEKKKSKKKKGGVAMSRRVCVGKTDEWAMMLAR